ncbi:hypothetical protein [Herbaspirillum huttiense]|uniref:hypothetical protein n=1 Tax=Herbaspirillum huttiense TaxID=863372 RepID=UPI0039B05DAE
MTGRKNWPTRIQNGESVNGADEIIKVTGQYPVYPGHPLTIAWEIMTVFPKAEDALKTLRTEQLNCPAAVADERITGGGGEVYAACDLLRRAIAGEPAEVLLEWADERWSRGNAGGHVAAVEPGQAQAEQIKPLFAAKLASWLLPLR